MKDPQFERKALTRLFSEKSSILDIGGGLRLERSKNNRDEDGRYEFLRPFLEKVEYRILDKIPDYHPDVVGDVHNLPFPDGSIDAIICNSVLEHVEEPLRAMREIYRVLKPGGYCFLYVPFLYYYHPEKGYYQDFYRFTIDGVKYLTREFSEVEISGSRGALETIMHLFPFFSRPGFGIFKFIDRLTGKDSSNQTSGYSAFCIK